ncbi:nucleoside-diphosphate sugar epimerase/dehydratase [Okibacterium endophyticum]
MSETQRRAHGPVSDFNLRYASQFGLDALVWVITLTLAELFRFDFAFERVGWAAIAIVGLSAALLHFSVGLVFGLYSGRYSYGTFEEVRAVVYSALVVGSVTALFVIFFGIDWGIPRSTGIIALPMAIVGMCGLRYVRRLVTEHRRKPGENARRTIVYGAGYIGETLIRSMLTDPHSKYRPVALLDDDPGKGNLQIRGVLVMGTSADLERVVKKTRATDLVICVGRADASLIRRVSDAATEVGVRVSVLPPFEDLLEGKTRVSDLRELSIEDLIGRQPVDTEVETIAGYLEGKRVLVTGAGGSIGAELCRQITKYNPLELIMLDRDETSLQGVQLSIDGHGLLHTKDVVLADIRDVSSLQKIFSERRPDVVFHAAALKHLPMLEQYPDEAWKTNVLGTLNVLNAARSAGVTTFVNISTDKAANPTSVLGHSKRAAEKLTAWMAGETGQNYLSVRFGNVIGSRGSMLPTFKSLIEAGGPLTVTHPDITRFFMTIPEACQLVVQAGGIGEPGEVLILDMGEPVRILDVAERMIAMSGKDIEIVFTGLREGEKLHEDLIGANETDVRPRHPKISHARVEGTPPELLDIRIWKERMLSVPRNNDTSVVGLVAASASGSAPQKAPTE